jgi:hypothetical protein
MARLALDQEIASVTGALASRQETKES